MREDYLIIYFEDRMDLCMCLACMREIIGDDVFSEFTYGICNVCYVCNQEASIHDKCYKLTYLEKYENGTQYRISDLHVHYECAGINFNKILEIIKYRKRYDHQVTFDEYPIKF